MGEELWLISIVNIFKYNFEWIIDTCNKQCKTVQVHPQYIKCRSLNSTNCTYSATITASKYSVTMYIVIIKYWLIIKT